jgi:hypothetical protein
LLLYLILFCEELIFLLFLSKLHNVCCLELLLFFFFFWIIVVKISSFTILLLLESKAKLTNILLSEANRMLVFVPTRLAEDWYKTCLLFLLSDKVY